MPGLDGKGPEGQGSQTGRGLGKCNPNNQNPENQAAMEEFRAGRGRRRGFGFNRSESAGKGCGRGFGGGRGRFNS